MLHNSLLIQELLKLKNNNPLCKDRRIVHNMLPLSMSKHPLPDRGDIQLDGKWTITFEGELPWKAQILDDLADFFQKMGLYPCADADNKVVLTRDASLAPGSFRLQVAPRSIRIAGASIEALWAGVIYMEREMGIRKGPWLPAGDVSKQPSWKVQISQAPWGSNFLVPDLSPDYLSDDAFKLLAHHGLNGMTIYGDMACYVNSDVFPELNTAAYQGNIAMLKDATERAIRYGIRLYYVPVSPKLDALHPLFQRCPGARGARLYSPKVDARLHCLCSSDDAALAFHAEFAKNLFKAVPLLGGLVLIIGGESYYHCYMNPARGGGVQAPRTNCPACASIPAERVVSKLVDVTAKGVHESQPDAIVLAWPYSAQRWSADPYQIDFIDAMPSGAGFLSEIDKDQWVKKDGYSKLIWDYSIDFPGPSDRIVEQADACHRRGTSMNVKMETALGLELIHVPYVPCMQRLAKKWGSVKGLHPAGVLQAWMFFGMWGSTCEELAWWANWHPEMSDDAVLRLIARRDFGKGAELVLQAWQEMSDAIGHLPCIPPYFMGPYFLGPAHPLIPDASAEIPRVFHGALYYKQEHEATFSSALLDAFEPLVFSKLPASPWSWGFAADDALQAWSTFIDECYRASIHSAKAVELLSKAAPLVQERFEVAKLAELSIVTEYIHRTLETTSNTIQFLCDRDGLVGPGGATARDRMVDVARRELVNSMAARRLYQEAPWLDLALRMEGKFHPSIAMLDEKIHMLNGYLETR
nr:hypothetical protein [Candidatus Sigynarchaeota archaeon]